jgi:hypothetical protein
VSQACSQAGKCFTHTLPATIPKHDSIMGSKKRRTCCGQQPSFIAPFVIFCQLTFRDDLELTFSRGPKGTPLIDTEQIPPVGWLGKVRRCHQVTSQTGHFVRWKRKTSLDHHSGCPVSVSTLRAFAKGDIHSRVVKLDFDSSTM